MVVDDHVPHGKRRGSSHRRASVRPSAGSRGAAPRTSGSTGQAEKRAVPTPSSGGTLALQLACAQLQRGWKAQPAGRANGVAGTPAIGLNGTSAALRVGQGEQQLLGVRVPRRGEHVAGRTGLDHAPGVEDRDPIGDARHHPEVVGDEQHPHAAALCGSPRISCSTPAWTVTSSAVVGSSAISSFGSQAIAIAITIRCRIPPEK